MDIINKVANKAKQRRINGGDNPLFDFKNEMNRLRDEIAHVLRFQISAHFSLVDECNDEDEKENDEEFERMRNVINISESFEFTNVKQWSDVVKIAEDSRLSREVQITLNESFKRDLNVRPRI